MCLEKSESLSQDFKPMLEKKSLWGTGAMDGMAILVTEIEPNPGSPSVIWWPFKNKR